MRVGTDGVLLGAWADVDSASRILDIGTGCGLIALMAAQRNEQAVVTGIDIHEPSVMQAAENVASSPFSDRVRVLCCDVREYRSSEPFDVILCNPPYYTENVLPPEEDRRLARNTTSLNFRELLSCTSRLISSNGLFSVILPVQTRDAFMTAALLNGFSVHRECHVRTVPGKAPKRLLLTLSKLKSDSIIFEDLILQDSMGHRSHEYAALTQDFYL